MRKVIIQVREYLKMPTQEEFDAMIAEGFEREEHRYAEWLTSQGESTRA